MKAKECIEKPRTGKWIKKMALAAAAFIMFSYLYSRGISPVWAAVAIVCFRGFFRFLYKIACLLVAAAILFCILSCLLSRFLRHTISGNETNAAYKPLQHLAGQGCPNGRLLWYPILYEDKDDGIRDGKEREAYTAIGRPGTTVQSWQTLLFGRQGRDPSGFAEKSSSPGGLAVFFPKALPFRKRLP